MLQVIGSKLEADEDLAGTSRVLPLRPSVSVWDVLAVCGGGGSEDRHVSKGAHHTHLYNTHIHNIKTKL